MPTKKKAHKVSLEWKKEDADRAIVRTDFLDRETLSLRVRSGWRDKLVISGNAARIEARNPSPFVDYDFDLIRAGLDISIQPVKGWDIQLSHGIFDFQSSTLFQDPDFLPDQSNHDEDGAHTSLELSWLNERWSFAGGYGYHHSDGVAEFSNERGHIRAGLRVAARFWIILETRHYAYQDTAFSFSDYEAETYALLFRWRL